MSNKVKKGLEIIRTNGNQYFVRVRKDNHSKEQLEARAIERAESTSWSRLAWIAIRDEGIAELIRPEAFQDLNDKDAYMAKASFIACLSMENKRVLNNPKTRALLKVA